SNARCSVGTAEAGPPSGWTAAYRAPAAGPTAPPQRSRRRALPGECRAVPGGSAAPGRPVGRGCRRPELPVRLGGLAGGVGAIDPPAQRYWGWLGEPRGKRLEQGVV